MRLGVRVGDGCAALHDEMMHFVQVNRLELDELWSYVGKKQKRITPTDPADLGDQYVFIGIDANLKAIISYRVGKRDGDNANAFLADLRRRIVNRPEISSDGFTPYLEAVERSIRSGLLLRTGNQPISRRAGYRHRAAVLTRRSSRGKAASADRQSAPRLHVLRRARQPQRSHGIAPLHTADKRLLKKAGEPCRRREPVRRPFQSMPGARSIADYPGNGNRDKRSHLEHWRTNRRGREPSATSA